MKIIVDYGIKSTDLESYHCEYVENKIAAYCVLILIFSRSTCSILAYTGSYFLWACDDQLINHLGYLKIEDGKSKG